MKIEFKSIKSAPLDVKILLYWEDYDHFEPGKRIIEDNTEFHSLLDGEMRSENPSHWSELPEIIIGK